MATFDRDRWRQIDEVLDVALDLAPDARSAYVARACGGDAALRQEVEQMLAASAASGSFLAEPAAHRAAQLIDTTDSNGGGSMIGRTIGAYRLTRELGEGGMGTVYEAERIAGDFAQHVAIKIAKQGLHSDHARRRFLQERQILANLQHDRIARLLDGGITAEGIAYFVMERVDGVPITEFCRDHALRVEDRIEKFLQVCDAVQYAHRNLIVHRDLKPSNILVDASGQVKLLDFGIAKLLDEHVPATLTSVRALTPEYAAPEQVRGDAVSTSTDVYALGVLLCELLSGARPYRLRSTAPLALEQAILEQDPSPPSTLADAPELRRRLKGDLDRIVLEALSKPPERRYPSVEALAADLQRHLEGRPVLAQGDALTYRARKFLRRHRIGVTAAALIALSLAGGLVATVTQMRKAQREAEQSRAVQEFLVGVFSASAPAQAQGHPPTARELLDRGAARIDRELKDQPQVRTRLQQILARIYNQLGEYDGAIALLRSSLTTLQQTGLDRVTEADVLDQLGLTLYQKSDFRQAITLGSQALDVARASSGADSVQAARAANNLAWYRRRLGEYDEAERLRRFALDVYRRRLGVDASETIALENDLGVLLADRGRFAEAEQLERRVLEANRRRLGEVHPDTLNAAYQLSRVLVEFGKPQEASDRLRAIIPVWKRVVGEHHDKAAMMQRMLAWALDDMGQYDEAMAVTNEALEIQKVALGPTDAQVAVTLRRRAEIAGHERRFADAERDALDSLAILTARFGEDNYDIGATRHVLAWILLGEGRVAEAAEQAERARANRQRYLGDEHPRLAETLDVLGDIEQARGNLSRARELHQQALQIDRAHLTETHAATRRAEQHLAALR